MTYSDPVDEYAAQYAQLQAKQPGAVQSSTYQDPFEAYAAQDLGRCRLACASWSARARAGMERLMLRARRLTSRVKTKPFSPEDLSELGLYLAPRVSEWYQAAVPILEAQGKKLVCSSFWLNGKLLYVSAFVEESPSLASMVIFTATYAYDFPEEFQQSAKWWIKDLLAKYGRVRYCLEDSWSERAWLEIQGFRLERGEPCSTVDGEDMFMWDVSWSGL